MWIYNNVECRPPSFFLSPLSRNLFFYSVFLFWSDQLGFIVFCFFLPRMSLIGRKIILIIYTFWQISSTFPDALILCAETSFSILKKVSAPITSGECSRGRLLQSLFCGHDTLEEIFFVHITLIKRKNCWSDKYNQFHDPCRSSVTS